jgi:hypothetical protein
MGLYTTPTIDFTKTTSLVVALTSPWSLIVKATVQNMEMEQLNVYSTFMYENVDKEIYLKQLEGF